jgi:hypothetical protein
MQQTFLQQSGRGADADAEALYDRHVRRITRQVGRDETTATQLNRYGRALMPGFFRGAFARGQEPPPDGTRHFVIVNGMSGPPGDHWHGVYREPGHPDLIYDSFGRGTRGFRGRGTERDSEQQKTGPDRDSPGVRAGGAGDGPGGTEDLAHR